MSINNQNYIPNISKHNRFSGKENNHSLSPNIRPLNSSNKPIHNNLFPKNQLLFSNNNNHHFNIKVNKITRKKEKIIEGDLNFNEMAKPLQIKNVQKQNIGNTKLKKRGMPNKSPLPIPGSFKPKDVLSFNRIFSSNSKYLRQQEQKKYNQTNNLLKHTGNQNYVNNYIFGGNLNMNMNMMKSMNRKSDRSHSPFLRPGDGKFMNIGLKVTKNRYISKSPNLGKSSVLNRNGTFSIALLNNNNNKNKKRIVKKIPSNNFKKINNINTQKKINTIINGEIYQDPFRMNNNLNNFNINSNKGNLFNTNIRPISSNNTLNISSNNTNSLLHNNNYSNNSINVLRNNNNKENALKNNFINSNNSHNYIRNIIRPISPKNNIENQKNIINCKNNNSINNNNNNNNLSKNNNNVLVKNNININKREEITVKEIQAMPKNEENKSNNNNEKNNNIPQKENQNNPLKEEELKNNQIIKSEEPHSARDSNSNFNNKLEVQTNQLNQANQLNPLNQINNNLKVEDKNENQKNDQNTEKQQNSNQNQKTTKKVIKKIRDILPYTHVGFDGEEPKENNQDNYFIFKNFADHKDYIYMSVCDGHGVEGHFVSEFIKEVLPYYMSENLKDRNILTEKEITHQIITETFIIVNNMLVSNENINSLFSGSTCVSVIFTPERLIVPNIGDSRAVLARFDKNTGKYKAIELSRDHKPTEKDEAKRIYDNDGRIQPFTEDGEFVGPQRVWIKEEEVPGLAMTRSFGDRVAATVGVMSEPEIKEFDFDENDKYMIIASDGIWEFISSQECIDIIQKYYESNDMKGCCDYLYQESSKRWLKEEEVIDDTTLILVFFE
jgi:serine/threonine protein phosphatase PrpC